MPKLDNLEEAIEAEIGERIRLRRASLGMSQAELAERIGMSFQQVQKYERGANRIASSILIRVADALDCAPGDLLVGAKSRNRRSNAVERRVDAAAARIKMLKSVAARKKILAALEALLAEAESAGKKPKPATAAKQPVHAKTPGSKTRGKAAAGRKSRR